MFFIQNELNIKCENCVKIHGKNRALNPKDLGSLFLCENCLKPSTHLPQIIFRLMKEKNLNLFLNNVHYTPIVLKKNFFKEAFDIFIIYLLKFF